MGLTGISRGVGDSTQNTFCGRGMDIFWKNTMTNSSETFATVLTVPPNLIRSLSSSINSVSSVLFKNLKRKSRETDIKLSYDKIILVNCNSSIYY